MSESTGSITLTLPRTALGDVLSLSATLVERMHELLERNTDGTLTPIERSELETLVHMAEFGQILSMALHATNKP